MKTIPKFTGTHPLVNDLNRLAECLAERTPIPSPDCPMEFHPHGYKPKPSPASNAAAPQKAFWRP